MRAFDRAIAIKPESYVYINRSMARPKTDLAGRQADLDAALKLQPKSPEVLSAMADLKLKQGDYTGAIGLWTARLYDTPDGSDLLLYRGIAYAKSGQQGLADKDFATARALFMTPQQWNESCWAKATAGVALQSALSDCDAALAKVPDNAAFRDSRAFVLLRLDRLDEAQADYDKALAQRAKSASSLFGRAVVEAKKGDKAKSASDLQAALKADPDVQTDFAGYGVSIAG
jgi:tetratricopeptide (TPR) repeat protein